MPMIIHQTIHDTLDLPAAEVMELIGAGDINAVIARQAKMTAFIKDKDWDEEEYKLWLRSANALPTKMQMARNVSVAGGQAVASLAERVSAEEYERRIAVCQAPCDYYIPGRKRCSECGCWTLEKAKLKAWECRIGNWDITSNHKGPQHD